MIVRINVVLLVCMFICSSCTDSFQKGAKIYEVHCAGCHGSKGEGFRDLYPPLGPTSQILQYPDELVCVIRYGIDSTHFNHQKDYTLPMYGIPELNDIDITNLINFLNDRYFNQPNYIKLVEVQEKLKKCQPLRHK